MSIFLDAIVGKVPGELSLEDLGCLFVATPDCDAPYPDYGNALLRLEIYRSKGLLFSNREESRLVSGTPPELIETKKIAGIYIGDPEREFHVIKGTNSTPQPAKYKAVFFFSRDAVQNFLDSPVGSSEPCRRAPALRAWIGEITFSDCSVGDGGAPVDAVSRGRYDGLSVDSFVKRDELIREFPNLERHVRETEGELAAVASCVRLVREGLLTMPSPLPSRGHSYWIYSEAKAWHDVHYSSSKVVPVQKRGAYRRD